jgi:hypothetical protein
MHAAHEFNGSRLPMRFCPARGCWRCCLRARRGNSEQGTVIRKRHG